MMNSLSKINELKKNYEEALQTALEPIRQEVVNEFAAWLREYKLESLAWTQYTPYFNDGDSCEFSSQTDVDSMWFNGKCYDDDFLPEEEEKAINLAFPYNSSKGWSDPGNRLNREMIKSAKEGKLNGGREALENIISQLNEDILEKLFDEGKIVINSNGTYEVEDYSHD